MSRLVLGLILLALSGCATLSQVQADLKARMAVARQSELPWECGEPAADASAHDDIGQSSGESGGEQ
jgi:hypothetical protein